MTNNGPSTDPAVAITDNPPVAMRNPVWTCAQCTETSGTGPIATTAALRSRQSITLTYSGVVDSGSVGTLTNEATVTPSAGVRDLNGSNNLSADIDTLRPISNIEITKSHVGPIVAGRPVSYDIRVINNGPSVANGVRVLDALPEGLTNAVWSCRGPGARPCETTEGTGSVDTRTNLAVGDVVMISLRADVNRDFVGTLTNTVRAFQPGTVIDPTPNNVGVDSAPVGVETNLRVRKRVQTEAVVEGLPITYEIIVENNGPSDAVGVVVRDVLPEGVLNAVWTCAAGPSAVCSSSSGGVPSNGVLTSVNLPNATSATFVVTGVAGPVASITNRALASVGNAASDPDLSDNQDQVTSKVQLVIREIVAVAEGTTSTTLPASGTVDSTPPTTEKVPVARVPDESNTLVEPKGAAPRSGVEERKAGEAGDQGRLRDGRVAARNANHDSPLGLAFTGFQMANFVVALLAIAVGACLVGLADPRFLGRRRRRRS